MLKNFHVKLGKTWPCRVEIDGIIEFLAQENVENDLTFFLIPRFQKIDFRISIYNEKIATFNTAKSR